MRGDASWAAPRCWAPARGGDFSAAAVGIRRAIRSAFRMPVRRTLLHASTARLNFLVSSLGIAI
eukprot:5081511-Alexandrium_andersonii.AAC.1